MTGKSLSLGTRSPEHYLAAARKHRTQAEIAASLGVSVRTIRRWEARECDPPAFVVPALERLLPFQLPFGADCTFTFVDLFAGVGGLRLPFDELGGRCVFTSEWDKYAQKTYVANFPLSHEIGGDITKIAAAAVPEHDLLLAGFPCQPFSIAGVSKKNALGRAHGFADETQGTLFFDLVRILKERRPQAFLLENVKNLQSHDGGRTFDVIYRKLTEELRYDVHVKVINAIHFVPQNRERIILVGFSERVGFDWNAVQLPQKGAHLLGDILHRIDGSEPVLPWDDARYFDHSTRKVNSKYTLTPHLWQYLKAYKEKHQDKGNGFGYGLVDAKKTARTLSARYYKDGSEILIDQGSRRSPRRLTPRECARLMGFPDTFRIPVSDTRAYKQFGNSVVVPVVREVARVMKQFLTAESNSQAELPIRAA